MKALRIIGLALSFGGLGLFFVQPVPGAVVLLVGLSCFGIGRISV